MTKKVLIVSVSFCVVLAVVIGLICHHRASEAMMVSRALNAINSLRFGQYQEAQKDFDSGLKAMKSPEALGDMWKNTIAMFGPLKECTVIGMHVRKAVAGKSLIPGKTVELSLVFQKQTVRAYIEFATDKEIIGLNWNERRYSKLDSVLVSRASSVLDSLQAGDYQAAVKDFHSAMNAKQSPEAVRQEWGEVVAKYGPLVSHAVTSIHDIDAANLRGSVARVPGTYRSVEVTLSFGKHPAYAYFTFDPRGVITGLKILDRRR